MKHLYFVRHAEPDHDWKEDRTRPLSPAGLTDRSAVTEALRDVPADRFISSPYQRTLDTLALSAADHGCQIATDERLREREQGRLPNSWDVMKRRWADFDYCEGGGESLNMAQARNIEAINELLRDDLSETIVIGTHGTALSTVLHYYDGSYGFDGFKRMIDYMPYIVRLDFEGFRCVGKEEVLIVEKPFLDRYLSSIKTRPLAPAEIPEALRLAWDTFLEFEAPDYEPKGVAKFKEYLDDAAFVGKLTFYGAFIHGIMGGVLATRESGSHIGLFFVRKEYQRHGIGRKLFTHVERACPSDNMTVNSSPFAVPIYGKLGFIPTDSEQVSDGIRYTPMTHQCNKS